MSKRLIGRFNDWIDYEGNYIYLIVNVLFELEIIWMAYLDWICVLDMTSYSIS